MSGEAGRWDWLSRKTDHHVFVEAQLNRAVHEAYERGKRDALKDAERERERLRRALEDLLENGGWGHSHWDSTRRHGSGCETCIEQREAKERAREALQEAAQQGAETAAGEAGE